MDLIPARPTRKIAASIDRVVTFLLAWDRGDVIAGPVPVLEAGPAGLRRRGCPAPVRSRTPEHLYGLTNSTVTTGYAQLLVVTVPAR